MPNKLRNWQYDDVKFFLECHAFVIIKQKPGSHEVWANEPKTKLVEVNKLHSTDGGYTPKTLISIMENSGYEREHWFRWSQLGKGQQKKCLCCVPDEEIASSHVE